MLGIPTVSVEQSLHLNNLEYNHAPVVSVVVTREFYTHPARELYYKVKMISDVAPVTLPTMDTLIPPLKDTIVQVDIPSGNRYVDPLRSYLAFECTITAPVETLILLEKEGLDFNDSGGLFARDSNLPARQGNLYTNLFKTAVWTHACRKEIDYVENAAHSAYLYSMRQPDDWQRSVASLFTLESPIDNIEGPPAVTRSETVIIPLSVLFPTWRANKGKLLPSHLVAGSSFTFTMNKPQDALHIYSEPFLLANQPNTIDFNTFQYELRDVRVILDERELLSSVDSLLWAVSATNGTPLQIQASITNMDVQDMTAEVFPTVLNVPINTLSTTIRQLSRVDDVLVTPVLLPQGKAIDAFVPAVRPPLIDVDDVMILRESRVTTGFRNWPQKEMTYQEVRNSVNAYLWMIHNPLGRMPALNVREYMHYIGGFYTNMQRENNNCESGVAVREKRPLHLRYGFLIDLIDLVLLRTTHQDKYALRYHFNYQMMLNVSGNVLETLV